jgi:hypothetical protein
MSSTDKFTIELLRQASEQLDDWEVPPSTWFYVPVMKTAVRENERGEIEILEDDGTIRVLGPAGCRRGDEGSG